MKIVSSFAACCAVWLAVLSPAAEARSRVSLLAEDALRLGDAPSAVPGAAVGLRVASLVPGRLLLAAAATPDDELSDEALIARAERRKEAHVRASDAFLLSTLIGGGVGLVGFGGLALATTGPSSYNSTLIIGTIALWGLGVGVTAGMVVGLIIGAVILGDAYKAPEIVPGPRKPASPAPPEPQLSITPLVGVLPDGGGLQGGVAVRF